MITCYHSMKSIQGFLVLQKFLSLFRLFLIKNYVLCFLNLSNPPSAPPPLPSFHAPSLIDSCICPCICPRICIFLLLLPYHQWIHDHKASHQFLSGQKDLCPIHLPRKMLIIMDSIYFLTDTSNVEISLVSCWLPVLHGFLYIFSSKFPP